MVVAAGGQEVGKSELRQGRTTEREGEFAFQDPLHVAPRGNPTDAVARRDGLGKRAAIEDVAARIQRHEGLGTLRAEIDIAIDVVLDQGPPVLRQQVQHRQLLLVGHRAPQRVG